MSEPEATNTCGDALLEAQKTAARAAYTLEPQRVSLRELLTRPAFCGLTYRQIYAWYLEEDWAQERRLNIQAWRRPAGQDPEAQARARRERELAALQHLTD